jgi:glutamate/tyrosine decarboxylase-like PLP-dependent enzyme
MIERDRRSLDPENWDEFRALAHRMVDDTIDYLRSLPDQPTWTALPDDVINRITTEPIPIKGQGEEAAYQAFRKDVLPYPNGNLKPRFFGWVQGNGIPLANMADMLASAQNAHLSGFNQAPKFVEETVVRWLANLMDFPKTCGGILESGGTMANILGLAVARHAKAGFDMRETGLQTGRPPFTVYCSTETHGWITKGVELLGLGNQFLRQVPVDDNFQMDLTALKQNVAQDRQAGLQPFCVIGTAGTVNTGATDDLHALADFCAKEDLWFHIDGAFGSLAKLSPKLAPIVAGQERADSIAFDLHKWMYLPFEISCLLVKDDALLCETFAHAPSYIAELERGVIAGGLPFSDRGVDLTRGFKALKAWMCLKAYGVETFAHLIEKNVALTRHLVSKIEDHTNLELLAPAPLNVACFRVKYDGLNDERLDALNLETLLRMQESGDAVPSSTVIRNRFALRFCNVNHRAQIEDVDAVLDSALKHSAEAR